MTCAPAVLSCAVCSHCKADVPFLWKYIVLLAVPAFIPQLLIVYGRRLVYKDMFHRETCIKTKKVSVWRAKGKDASDRQLG